MNQQALRAQLVAIRAQVDALLVQVADDEPAGREECPHPQNQRRDLSVMGGPQRWECRLCGHTETSEVAG